MSRFGGRMIVALAVWLGMAMLGYGPRASASFLPFATEVPQASSASDSGPAEVQKDELPAVPDAPCVFQVCDFGAKAPIESGAGSNSSNTSSGPNVPSVALASGQDCVGPTLTTRLRDCEGFLIPDPHIAAILDPPRAGC